MDQLIFFNEPAQNKGYPTDLLDYLPGIFTPAESHHYVESFQEIFHPPGKRFIQGHETKD